MSGIQVVTLILAVFVMFVELAWMRKNKNFRFLALPTLSWMFHIAIFYLSLLIETPEFQINHTSWSAVLRLHGILNALAYAAYRLYRSRNVSQ